MYVCSLFLYDQTCVCVCVCARARVFIQGVYTQSRTFNTNRELLSVAWEQTKMS